MTRDVIAKAAVLVEALPYIQRFRGETVVVKFGGSIMGDSRGVMSILQDVAFMACVGMRPVIVHGGGKAISRAMKEADMTPVFRNGLRVTDEAALRVVEHVLNHEVNEDMVRMLGDLQCRSRGIHGDDILTAVQRREKDPETGEEHDWGYVGNVSATDPAPIRAFLDGGITPVITPLARGSDRHVYNVNADEAAAAVARGLRARKLVYLSDVPGLLEDVNDPASIFSTVRINEVQDLIARGVIAGGMLPKIEGGVRAVESGVNKVHLIDSSLPHSLLLELFTDRGVGTEIVP